MKKILPLVACSLLAFSLIACHTGSNDASAKAPEASSSSVEVSDDLKSGEYETPTKEESQTLLSSLIAALQADENLPTAFGSIYASIGEAAAENKELADGINELVDFFGDMEDVFKSDTDSASNSVNFDYDEISILDDKENGVEAKIYNADVSLNVSSELDQKNQTQTVGVKGDVDASVSLKVDLEKAADKVAKDSVLKQVYASATVSGNMDLNGTVTLESDTDDDTVIDADTDDGTDTDVDTDTDDGTVIAGTVNASADAGITASFLVDNTAGILVVNGNAKINLDDSAVKAVEEEAANLLEYLKGNLTFTIYDVNGTEIDSQTVELKDFIKGMLSGGNTDSNSDSE